MGTVFLIIGTVASLVFIIFLFRGEKYDPLLEPLTGNDYPLKEIYSAGLSLQDIPLFKLSGSLGKTLRDQTALYYGKQYSEYYARIIWAQTLSFAFLIVGALFLLAGMSSGTGRLLFGALGIVVPILFGYFFLHHTAEKIADRKTACEEEFPNAISKLALLVNSGVILRNAWEMVAGGKAGTLYDLMQNSCEDMKNGKSEIDALYEFGMISGSDDVKKFSTALIQSIERGGGELPIFLTNQSSELWAQKRQYLLQKGEKAASALLAPIGLMFAGVMLIVVAAAMSSFGI